VAVEHVVEQVVEPQVVEMAVDRSPAYRFGQRPQLPPPPPGRGEQ
jgi:hypothetical protein